MCTCCLIGLPFNGQCHGRIQDLKLEGGALKKLSCQAEGGTKILGVFRVKIRKKIIFFPILRGAQPNKLDSNN